MSEWSTRYMAVCFSEETGTAAGWEERNALSHASVRRRPLAPKCARISWAAVALITGVPSRDLFVDGRIRGHGFPHLASAASNHTFQSSARSCFLKILILVLRELGVVIR